MSRRKIRGRMEARGSAYHEAARAVLSEALGWSVQFVKLLGGGESETEWRFDAPSPEIEAAVVAAGVAARKFYADSSSKSSTNRRNRTPTSKTFTALGIREAGTPFALAETEYRMRSLFDVKRFDIAVRRVADELASEWYLSRSQFLKLATRALTPSARKQVRQLAQEITEDILERHSSGGES